MEQLKKELMNTIDPDFNPNLTLVIDEEHKISTEDLITQYLSKTLYYIGLTHFIKIMKSLLKSQYKNQNHYNELLKTGITKPIIEIIISYVDSNMIISIGSGNGIVEKYCDDVLKTDIICIDPKFNEFNNAPLHLTKKPKYAKITQMKIVSDCTLIINYSLPNNSMYDIEAIRYIEKSNNLKNIIIAYDPSGTAGSKMLIEWIHIQTEYNTVANITRHGIDELGWDVHHTLIWLSKDITPKPELHYHIPESFQCPRRNCTIC